MGHITVHRRGFLYGKLGWDPLNSPRATSPSPVQQSGNLRQSQAKIHPTSTTKLLSKSPFTLNFLVTIFLGSTYTPL
uniref:Uncharacterized protein n=1 Tax=Oryza nivara TaxID=4536 RepID=A0A0E0J692_ORYNI